MGFWGEPRLWGGGGQDPEGGGRDGPKEGGARGVVRLREGGGRVRTRSLRLGALRVVADFVHPARTHLS
jgi:hypothetical protein